MRPSERVDNTGYAIFVYDARCFFVTVKRDLSLQLLATFSLQQDIRAVGRVNLRFTAMGEDCDPNYGETRPESWLFSRGQTSRYFCAVVFVYLECETSG